MISETNRIRVSINFLKPTKMDLKKLSNREFIDLLFVFSVLMGIARDLLFLYL